MPPSVLVTSFSPTISKGFDFVLVARLRVVEDLESRFLPPGDSASRGTPPGVRGVIGVLGVEGILETTFKEKS